MGSRRVQFCLLALLAMHASAEKCKPSTCFSSNQSPIYSPPAGQQYTYEFESSATSQLINKESVETSVSLRGNALVTVGENCGYTLTLQNVVASGADNSRQQIKDFSLPVQFTLSGDELAPEICADTGDNMFSLNIKRGIISALQNGVQKGYELDIFGKCPVVSTSSTNGGVTTVTRSKDLDQCAYREKLVNGLMQSVTTESSNVKTSPLLNGKVESDAKYQGNVLQSVEIRENYNYLPFSTQEHGAKAKVTTKLNLKRTAAATAQGPKNGVQRTLLFGNANENLASQKVKESIKSGFDKALKEFIGQEGRITNAAATTFADLVRLMRLAKRSDLVVSYNSMKSGTLSAIQSRNKDLSRSLFLDALYRTGTGESVAALVDLSKKELDDKEKKLMYLSFNLVTSVTKEAITELSKLFKDNLPKEAYLSIGNLVSKFCRDIGCDANEVKIIAEKFVAKIPKDCVTKNKQDEEHLVSVLKGIRNSQTILNTALTQIISCVGSQRPSRVRVAAFHAFTANPCNKKLQQAAIQVMKNHNEDSEVRIEAYLAAVECPNGQLANEISKMLETETINQVGTFVTSHLDSIKASTDPKRESARYQFRNLRTNRKFPFDPRRYSFNREVSYAIDSLGLGSSVDTSVIYSQRSFLPRSVRFNVTGNLFGNSFNFLEFSARQENLESVIEHYFGPRGFFNRLSKQELYNEVVKEFSALDRSKRALPQDLAAFDKGVKLPSELSREPDIDLSLKIFGSELYFLSLSQNIPSTPSEFIKFITAEMHKGVDALKNFNYNFENHGMWLDSEIVYPTALGLPFKLTATGASAVKIDLSGSVDIKAILENPLDSKVEINYSPSANIFLSGTIGFNAYAFESGIEVSGTFYTNTGANTTIEMSNGKSFTVNTIPTTRDQFIADISHKISVVTQESGREAIKVPIKFKGSDGSSEPCFDQVEFLLGASFCLHMESTAPGKPGEHAVWPLYGSSRYALRLEMVDSITFRTELDMNDPEQPVINFYLDTPKDNEPRRTTVKLLASIKPTHYFGGFAVDIPWFSGKIEGDAKLGVVNENSLKKIYALANYQGQKREYELGFKRNGNEIIPILKFDVDMIFISGKIIENQTPNGISYTLRQVKFGRDNYQTTIDGSISIDGNVLKTNLKFDSGGKQVSLDGSVGYDNGEFTSDVLLQSPSYPSANGKLTYKLKHDDAMFSNDLVVIYDKDLNTKVKRFSLSQLADWNDDMCKIKNELSIGHLQTEAKLNGEFSEKIMSLDSKLAHQKSVTELKIDNKYSQRQPHDYETSLYAAANKKSLKLEMSRDIEGDSSRLKNKLELSTGLRVEVNGKVSHVVQYRNADISLQALFVPGQKKDQSKILFSLKNTPKGHDGSLKVTTNKNEIAGIETKLTYGPDVKGTVKGSVKDFGSVDGTYESKRGKGTALLDITMKDKKLRSDTKFTIQKPTYDFETDFYYDYEKDNSKKLRFATSNKIDDLSLDSKNTVEILSEKYGLNVAASRDNSQTPEQGKRKANVELQLPTGRKLSFGISKDVNVVDGIGTASGHFTATDELPNRKTRQLIGDAKINDINTKKGFFDYTASFKYKDFDNKDLKLQVALKNLAKGHFATANGNLQVDGVLMPHTLTMNVKIDEYCSNHAIYAFDGKYGDFGSVDVGGKFYVATKDRPYTHEFTGNLDLPKTELKKITVKSNAQISEPADDNGVYAVKYSGSLEYPRNKLQVETELNLSKTKGTGSAKLQIPNVNPISGDFKFNCNHKDAADGAFTFNYGSEKLSSSFKAQMPNEKALNIQASVQGTQIKDLTVNVEAKQPEENSITAKITGKVDGENFAIDYEHRVSPQNPKFYVLATCPKGTKTKILLEANVISPMRGKGTFVVENLNDFNLEANLDADVAAIETFFVRGDVASSTLNIEKYVFDIHARQAGGRSGVEYSITRGGQHVISGTSDFTTKTDKGRTIIEGKSTIKLTDGKSDDVNFKIIRNVYEKSRDGETGFGGIVTITVGPRNYIGEAKLTDKEFHTKYSGCAKKTTCTSLEAKSVLEKSSITDFKHNLLVSVDLRQVGFPHEFRLKSETIREGIDFKHNLDAQLQSKDKPEYQYSLFINPKSAGAVFSMPKREIALDASYKYPTKFYGDYESHVTFYLDKRNKPQQKSELGFRGKVQHEGSSKLTGKGDFTFTHPRVKPMRIGGDFELNVDTTDLTSKVEFDIFTKPMDKIVVAVKYGNDDHSGKGFNITSNVEIYSKGLDFKVQFHEYAGLSYEKKIATCGFDLVLPIEEGKIGYHLSATDKNFDVVYVLFNKEISRTTAVYDLNTYDFDETTTRNIGGVSWVTKINIKKLTEGRWTTKGGRNIYDFDGGYTIGKDLHAIVKSSGKEAFKLKVDLSPSSFLKTEYKVDDQEVKALSEKLKQLSDEEVKAADAYWKDKFGKVETYGKGKVERLVKALPDFRAFNDEYSKEITSLVNEFQEDPNIKKFFDVTSKYIEQISKLFGELTKVLGEQIEVIQKLLADLTKQVFDAYEKNFQPILENIVTNVRTIVQELIDQSSKIISGLVDRTAKALKAFEDDINKLSQSFKEITSGVYETATQFIEEISKEIRELLEQLQEQIKNLPGLEAFKEKLNELFGGITPLQALIAVFEELIQTVKDFVPENANPFFDKFSNYISNKLNGVPVNDVEVLREIYALMIDAFEALRKEYLDTLKFTSAYGPFNLEALKRLPPFITNVRFSLINQLTNDPLVSLKDVLYLYRPYAFDPSEVFPPFTMHGEIADGKHIFTFDDRHLTFPGTCSYILARDFAEGNFSIVANMKDGKMKSISVTDKNGFIEVNSDGLIKFRDRDSDFPIHEKTLHAWRDYFTFSILTQFGAEVECAADLSVCHVEVSGYYAGRVRGLFGNGNGEPYDDFVLPDGKITADVTEFGNSYKTQKQCGAVAAVAQDTSRSQSNEFCAQYFGRDSSLRVGFVFVNPTSYRETCEQATSGATNPQEEACKIAAAYVSRLRVEFIPLSLPKACAQCAVGASKVDVGDEVSVKVPQKEADIVVVFDTSLGKELSLVTEVMNEVRKELRAHGITDVQVIAIGYNANDRFVSQYTTKGKFDYRGRFENARSTGIPEEEVVKTGNRELDEAVQEIEKSARQTKSDLGRSPDARAFQKAVAYPFRATATKTIIAVRSDGIPYSLNPTKLTAGRISKEYTSSRGIGIHAFMPVNILEPAEKAKNIVGFNSNVALLINEKKRPNMGSVDVASKLKYEQDMGVDLTKESGYVFNTKNYATDKKKFVGVAAYVLADTIARTEVINECHCALERGLYPATQCVAKQTQLLAPKKTTARG